MKLWVFHGKKVLLILVISFFMIIMVLGEMTIHNKLKLNTFTQNNINCLKEYSDNLTGIRYLLPRDWLTKRKEFGGGEILYHNDFKSKDSRINGYVQVWHSKKSLPEFLQQSKVISEKQNKILQYNKKTMKTDGGEGYLVTYNIEVKPNVFYRAEEYFIQVHDKFIRVSFFVNKKDYNNSISRIFKTILDTVKF